MNNADVDSIIEKHKGDAGSLIRALLEIQEEAGWLTKETLEKVSRKLNVPLSKVEHIATFYKNLNAAPGGRHEVHVCNGTSCHIRGSGRILDAAQEITGIKPGETDAEMKFSLKAVTCMGRCAAGPTMTVDEEHYVRLTPDKASEVLKNCD